MGLWINVPDMWIPSNQLGVFCSRHAEVRAQEKLMQTAAQD
jgi:hypothetical protein